MVITQEDTLLKSLTVSSNSMQIENIYKEPLDIPVTPLAEFAVKNGVGYLGKKNVDLASCLNSLMTTLDSAVKSTS